jgi:ABC-type multidrug transport system fused ATPase/permease subunit
MQRLRDSAEWRFFSVLLRSAPALTVAWWLFILVRAALPIAFAIGMGWLVTAIQRGDAVALPLAVAGLAFAVQQALGPIHDAISGNLGARLSGWLHDRLLDACLAPQGLAHLEDPALADQLAAARDFDAGVTGPPLTVSMPPVGGGLTALMAGFGQAAVLAAYRWWAPLVVGGAWLSTHYFLRKGAIWRGRHSSDVIEKQRRADYAYRLTVQAPGAKEVRLFGLGDWVVDGFARLRRELLDLSWADRRLGFRPTRNAMLCIAGANVLFFGVLARDASLGNVSVGELVVFAQAALGTSALAFSDLDWWLRSSAQPVPLVLDLVARMQAIGALATGTRAAAVLPAREIRFEGVGFAYPHSERAVLKGFDLTIPAGRSLAIVGQNGAGKTTLAKLLCRLYEPTAGRIVVDGSDVRQLELDAWRARIAAVFQDFVRWELSLRDNVAPGGRSSDDDVHAALEIARASKLADLDTVLSRAYAGGTDLSGGQWQRVALARALHSVRAGAGIVILDEPTAQLDVRGEAEIFERLLDATRGCTTILISHRFSTVRHADLICVIEQGAVVELGSHDELMAKGGRYRTMFDLQASRFQDPSEAGLDTLEAAG